VSCSANSRSSSGRIRTDSRRQPDRLESRPRGLAKAVRRPPGAMGELAAFAAARGCRAPSDRGSQDLRGTASGPLAGPASRTKLCKRWKCAKRGSSASFRALDAASARRSRLLDRHADLATRTVETSSATAGIPLENRALLNPSPPLSPRAVAPAWTSSQHSGKHAQPLPASEQVHAVSRLHATCDCTGACSGAAQSSPQPDRLYMKKKKL
jgi:hypothetical protein